MNKIKLILCIVLTICISACNHDVNAQAKAARDTIQYRIEGNNYIEVKTNKTTSADTMTDYTYTNSKGVTYPIYITPNGRCYIIVTAKKSGRQYKNYLPKGISINVCDKLGIEYKENKQ